MAVVGVLAAMVVPGIASASLLDDPDGVDGAFMPFGFPNLFDPVYGFVPPGYGNSSPEDHLGVPVVDPGVEFGYLNGFSGVEVDLAGETVKINQFLSGGQGPGTANGWDISLDDLDGGAQGAILGLIELGNEFPGLVPSYTLDSLHFQTPAGYFLGDDGLEAEYEIVFGPPPIPEPASVVVWSLLAGLGIFVGWRRKRAA
jgi:hypothetical protein